MNDPTGSRTPDGQAEPRRSSTHQQLQQAIADAGLVPAELAEMLGVHPKTVTRWLGGRTPRLRHRLAIADAVGVDPEQLWPSAHRPAPRPQAPNGRATTRRTSCPPGNVRLRRAMAEAGLREREVAARAGVDPRTVERWLDGRLPRPRHRFSVATLLQSTEHELWPRTGTALPITAGEVLAVYPSFTTITRELWGHLLAGAAEGIDALGDVAVLLLTKGQLRHNLAEVGTDVVGAHLGGAPEQGRHVVPNAAPTVSSDAGSEGVAQVRLCLPPPVPLSLTARADDEARAITRALDHARQLTRLRGHPLTSASRPLTSTPALRAVAASTNGPSTQRRHIEVRVLNERPPLSLCRIDDDLLVGQPLPGRPARATPVFHLRHQIGQLAEANSRAAPAQQATQPPPTHHRETGPTSSSAGARADQHPMRRHHPARPPHPGEAYREAFEIAWATATPLPSYSLRSGSRRP